jgi:type I restriction enzyme S subunit
MGNSRVYIPLNDFITLQRGFDLPQNDRISGVYPVVASTDIVGYHNEWKVEAPGVVIGRSGSIGGGQYITENFWPLNTTLWVKDFKNHNPRYVYYLLKSIDFSSFNVGSGVPTLNRNHLSSILVRDLGKEAEDQIAQNLGQLDDKITLNRQINQTLEQMAQTLFKSWFVDFDPVIDNALDAGNEIPEVLQTRAELRQKVRASQDFQPLPADVRALFPAEFEESELGWVPKGWANATLDKLTDILSGFAFKSNDFSDVGDAVIKIKNINSDRTVDIFDVQCIPTSVSLSAGKFKLGDGALIMAMTGATVGKFGLLVTENEEPYFLNQRVAKFEPKIDSRVGFLYCQLSREESEDFIVNTAQGSAQPNISASSILSMPLIIPSENLVFYFNSFVDSNFSKIIRNRKENIALTQFRDTLLPKLISGELRLDEIPSP